MSITAVDTSVSPVDQVATGPAGQVSCHTGHLSYPGMLLCTYRTLAVFVSRDVCPGLVAVVVVRDGFLRPISPAEVG